MSDENKPGLFDDDEEDLFKSTVDDRPIQKERTDSIQAAVGDDLFDEANDEIDLNDDNHPSLNNSRLKLQTNGLDMPPPLSNASPTMLTPTDLSSPPPLNNTWSPENDKTEPTAPVFTPPFTSPSAPPILETRPAEKQSPAFTTSAVSPESVSAFSGMESPVVSPFATATAPRAKLQQSSEDTNEPIDIEPKIDITISQYEKRGDGMHAFMVFKVVTKVPNAIAGLAKKEYIVWRRFSDFLGLHEKLVTKFLSSGRIIPPAPEKNVIGMTKTKMGKTVEDDSSTAEFLERRRAALERFLKRTALHPSLLQDPDFREFISLDGDLPKASNTAALSGANMMRLLNKVGDTFSKMTIKMDDGDTWFRDREFEIAELDEQLKKLHSAVEYLVQYRKELGSATEAFCKSLSTLAACEENTSLSRALSLLVETEEQIANLQQDQSEKDLFIFAEVVKDYMAIIGAIKDVFQERCRAWQTWQTAQQTLVKKREAKARFELAAKADKLPVAKKEVQDWEIKVEESEAHFAAMSEMFKKEMRRFDAQRIRDFKHMLLQYLESLAQTQQQMVKHWETFLPEAKAVTS